MAGELFGWIQDLGSYAKAIGIWQKERKPGGGIDYRSTEYKGAVRRTVEKLHPRRMQFKVTEVIEETPTTKTLRMERTDGKLPPFRPGQYVNLFLETKEIRTSRPYSISSVPGSDALDLTIRVKEGGFVSSHLVSGVNVGDEFTTTGPSGHFYHEPLIDGKDLVFIAGGSGVTPFMGILRWAKENGWPFRATLLYGCRTEQDVIFGKELETLAKENREFTYTLVVSEPSKKYKGQKGFISSDAIKKTCGDVSGKMFYLCGPGAMYDFCQPELEKLGVPAHKIRRELYGPPDDVTKLPGWPSKINADQEFRVEVEGGKMLPATAGEPLINSLEKAGIVVEAICRSGECSACRTKILEGKVFTPPNMGVRESDEAHGYVHACVAYPIEDLKIRL